MSSSTIDSPGDNPITTLPPLSSGFQTIGSLAKELADRLAALSEEDRDDDTLKVAEELAKKIRDREEQQIRQDVQDLERVLQRLSRTAPEQLKGVLAGAGFQGTDMTENLTGGKIDGAVRVERGERGEKGEAGEKGEKGEKGDKGEMGTFRRTYPHYNVMDFSEFEKLSQSELAEFDCRFVAKIQVWVGWGVNKIRLSRSLKEFIESYGITYDDRGVFGIPSYIEDLTGTWTTLQKVNYLAEIPSVIWTTVPMDTRRLEFLSSSYVWRTIIDILEYRNLVSKL